MQGVVKSRFLNSIKREMATIIRIEVSDEPAPDAVHRFRNFGEDVYRALKDICLVSIKEIDAATKSFTVQGVQKRDLGIVTQVIKNELKRHNLASAVRLHRL